MGKKKPQSYFMLGEAELDELLRHAFMEGWWTHDNGGKPVKDHGTIQRDNYVYKKMQELKHKRKIL